MPLSDTIQSNANSAVLARNFPDRLEEFVEREEVTHRSGKPWTTAKYGVEKWGRLPLYYIERDSGGMVTHKGYISEIAVNPVDGDDVAERLREQISPADTYEQYNDELDTTTFLATHGERVAEPFHQSELQKLSGNGAIAENYSRQPAYVIHRPGDFPDR